MSDCCIKPRVGRHSVVHRIDEGHDRTQRMRGLANQRGTATRPIFWNKKYGLSKSRLNLQYYLRFSVVPHSSKFVWGAERPHHPPRHPTASDHRVEISG